MTGRAVAIIGGEEGRVSFAQTTTARDDISAEDIREDYGNPQDIFNGFEAIRHYIGDSLAGAIITEFNRFLNEDRGILGLSFSDIKKGDTFYLMTLGPQATIQDTATGRNTGYIGAFGVSITGTAVFKKGITREAIEKGYGNLDRIITRIDELVVDYVGSGIRSAKTAQYVAGLSDLGKLIQGFADMLSGAIVYEKIAQGARFDFNVMGSQAVLKDTQTGRAIAVISPYGVSFTGELTVSEGFYE